MPVGPIRNFLRKTTLRTFIRATARKATGDTKEALEKALKNDDAFDAIYEGLGEEFDSQFSAGAGAGTLQDFFQWLLDHADEIIAFIQMIIALFA